MDGTSSLMQLLRATERRLRLVEHAYNLATWENVRLRAKLDRVLLAQNALGSAVDEAESGKLPDRAR